MAVDNQQPPDLKINTEFLTYLTYCSEARWLERLHDATRKLPVLLELRLAQQHAILYVSHQDMSDQALLR